MDGLIINNVIYKVVKDTSVNPCDNECAISELCSKNQDLDCIAERLSGNSMHLEKVNSVNDLEDDKQSEIPNQTYFY